jgi:protein O-mannosyl-transferase
VEFVGVEKNRMKFEQHLAENPLTAGAQQNSVHRIGTRHLLLALVLGATFVAYVGTLGFSFVNDDFDQIVMNAYVHSWHFAPRYFTEHIWSAIYPDELNNYYRPVFLLWFRINHMLFGFRPAGWHLGTVLLHLLATGLVYMVARRLLRDPLAAGLAMLIFGVDPVHIESVAWVSGLSEPLTATLFLGAFFCYLNGRTTARRPRIWLSASLFLYGLAALSKETALAFPLLLFAYEWFFPVPGAGAEFRARVTTGFRKVAPYLVLTMGYLAVRWRVLGGIGHALTDLSLRTVVLTWPSLLFFYLRHLIWPFNLSPYYALRYIDYPNLGGFVFPLAMVAMTAAIIVWYAQRSREVAFAGTWMLLLILPVLNIQAFDSMDFAHDRYLYLPSVGFSMLAALALRRLQVGERRAFGQPVAQVLATIGLAGLFMVMTVTQSFWWANDFLHATRSVAIAPENICALHNLATETAARGYPGQAAQLYQKVLARNPKYWPSVYNLGVLYLRLGRLPDAERYFHRAAEIKPVDPRAYAALGVVRLQMGRLDEAKALIQHAIELGPNALGYHLALGVVLKAEGDLPAALIEFRTELVNQPGSLAAREQIAKIETGPGNNPTPVSPSSEPPGLPIYRH